MIQLTKSDMAVCRAMGTDPSAVLAFKKRGAQKLSAVGATMSTSSSRPDAADLSLITSADRQAAQALGIAGPAYFEKLATFKAEKLSERGSIAVSSSPIQLHEVVKPSARPGVRRVGRRCAHTRTRRLATHDGVQPFCGDCGRRMR